MGGHFALFSSGKCRWARTLGHRIGHRHEPSRLSDGVLSFTNHGHRFGPNSVLNRRQSLSIALTSSSLARPARWSSRSESNKFFAPRTVSACGYSFFALATPCGAALCWLPAGCVLVVGSEAARFVEVGSARIRPLASAFRGSNCFDRSRQSMHQRLVTAAIMMGQRICCTVLNACRSPR